MTLYENALSLPSMEAKFEITFDGLIWNTRHEGSWLCIESRNSTSHETTFHTLNLDSLEISASFIGHFDKWMSGLETIHNDNIVIHGYDKEQNIHKKGIALYDLDGNLLNEYDYLTFEFISPEGIIASDPNEELVLIEKGNLFEYKSKKDNKITNTEVLLPIHYLNEDAHFKTFKEFILQKKGYEAVHSVEYLEINNKLLISYYLYEGKQLTNCLLLLNSEGDLLYEVELDQELSGIGYGTFFVINNVVYFIKNKTTLIGIDI